MFSAVRFSPSFLPVHLVKSLNEGIHRRHLCNILHAHIQFFLHDGHHIKNDLVPYQNLLRSGADRLQAAQDVFRELGHKGVPALFYREAVKMEYEFALLIHKGQEIGKIGPLAPLVLDRIHQDLQIEKHPLRALGEVSYRIPQLSIDENGQFLIGRIDGPGLAGPDYPGSVFFPLSDKNFFFLQVRRDLLSLHRIAKHGQGLFKDYLLKADLAALQEPGCKTGPVAAEHGPFIAVLWFKLQFADNEQILLLEVLLFFEGELQLGRAQHQGGQGAVVGILEREKSPQALVAEVYVNRTMLAQSAHDADIAGLIRFGIVNSKNIHLVHQPPGRHGADLTGQFVQGAPACDRDNVRHEFTPL